MPIDEIEAPSNWGLIITIETAINKKYENIITRNTYNDIGVSTSTTRL